MPALVSRRTLARVCIAVGALGAGVGTAVAAGGSTSGMAQTCSTQTITDERNNKVIITVCHP